MISRAAWSAPKSNLFSLLIVHFHCLPLEIFTGHIVHTVLAIAFL